MNDQLIVIGKIVGSFGIKGEMKIYPLTNDWSILERFKRFFYLKNDKLIDLKVESLRVQNKTIVAKIVGFSRIEDVEALKNIELLVYKKDLPDLSSDEYYVYELIGMDVFTDDKEPLGKIIDVMETGAHNIYVVSDGVKEVLLPSIDQVVLERNLEERKMVVHILPGLLD